MRPICVPVFLMLAVLTSGCIHKPVVEAPPPPSPPAPRPQPTPKTLAEQIDAACEKMSEQIKARLPSAAKVAVLPMADEKGGVRRIGVVMAEGLEAALAAQGVRVVERKQLQKILDEQALQSVMAADSPQAAKVRDAGRLAKATVLIVGRLSDAGKDVLFKAKALDVARPGTTIATTRWASLPAKLLGRLMWYVQRPPGGPAVGGELPPLAVRYEFVTQGLYQGEARIAEGSTVRSGQRFKVRVQANSDCHLYVILYDSKASASVLFPHKQIGVPNRVRGGVSYELPEGTKWYWFDENPGTERFYVVASYQPLANLDEILARMRQAGADAAQLSAAARRQIDTVIAKGMTAGVSGTSGGYRIRRRGVGGVIDVGWGGENTSASAGVDEVIIGHATAVKRFSVQHR